ncbi:MAG: Uma2 family endonuclease [Planctomycetaceae bacterium]
MSPSAVRYSPCYTVDDYEQWEGDWELWNGVAVCMSPSPSPLHQYVATSLVAEIREQLRKNKGYNCVVITEADWRIDSSTVVRPDVSVLCHGLPKTFIDYTPALVAEVLSPSTQHKDSTAHLIIDADKKAIEFLELDHDQFVERLTSDDQINLSLEGDCQIQLTLERIFSM